MTAGSGRRHVSSGGPWEASVGYSRALAIGDHCWVSGTSDAGADGTSQHPGDAGAQAQAIFAIIERALDEAGFGLADIVRTRLYIVDPGDAAAVLEVHGSLFRDIRPVATLVTVAGLLDASLLVEIEAEAQRA